MLSTAGAAALLTVPSGGGSEAASPDPAALDRYLAQLSTTVPKPPGAAAAETPPKDPDFAKKAARLDRAEPILGAVFSVAR